MRIDGVSSAGGQAGALRSASAPGKGNFSALFEAAMPRTGAQRDYDTTALASDFKSWASSLSPAVQSKDYVERVEQHSAGFLDVLKRAGQQGGFDQPIGFLKSLDRTALAHLQAIHSLADPIDPSSLSEEGALNLLMPPNARKDINHDGFLNVGAALTSQFPPVDAPEAVKQAWADATKGMDSGQLLMAQVSFMPIIPPGGTPADAHAYLGPNADYPALVQQTLENVIYAKRFDQPWQQPQRDEQIAFLRRFGQALA
jgi:hypothetical protein